jgi:hypothetical protein
VIPRGDRWQLMHPRAWETVVLRAVSSVAVSRPRTVRLPLYVVVLRVWARETGSGMRTSAALIFVKSSRSEL